MYLELYNHDLFIVVSGSVTLDELMTGLMSAHETFQQAMDVEIREEVREILICPVGSTNSRNLNQKVGLSINTAYIV